MEENKYKVKLMDASDIRQRLVMDVSPDIIETKTVEYKSYAPVHLPTGIHVFSHAASRNWGITNIKLIARTEEEATINLAKINLLRSWTTPSFGEGSRYDSYEDFDKVSDIERDNVYQVQEGMQPNPYYPNRQDFGAPPAMLLFSAYSNMSGSNVNRRRNLYKIPVVITQYSIPYTSDVDYIPTTAETGRVPIPTVMTIDITIQETHSPNELGNRFSLQSYKQGILDGF